jgi:hypothetical protein
VEQAMSLSDVIPVTLTADTNALDADSVAQAQTPSGAGNLTINGADASGGVATFSAGRILTVLSAADDTGKTLTVTGTDVNGDTQTEEIVPADTGTKTGTKYFKTVTQVAIDAAAAGNLSVGHNASCADVVFAGRARLKGVYLTSTATAGTIDFLRTSPTGTSMMGLSSVASATATRDVVIPEDGVLFSDGIYVQYTVSTFLTLTAFHA